MQSRNKSRPYRLASPAPANKLPTLSDDSLSEKIAPPVRKRRPRSAFTSYESPPQADRVDVAPANPPSVYLIEVKNDNRPTNAHGLTKTITYVWRNSQQQHKHDDDGTRYPTYSIEQVPPVFDHDKRIVPVSSRHVTLQRGSTDSWHNQRLSPPTILTSTCQNQTGSASNLLAPALDARPAEPKPLGRPTGQIISVTTTKRQQPSLLNERQNTEWNVEGDGKHIRYSNLKWYSAEQLPSSSRAAIKPRPKRRQQVFVDSSSDAGSFTDQHNRSAPPILQHHLNVLLTSEIDEGRKCHIFLLE